MPLDERIWTLLSKFGILRVLSCFDVDRSRGSLALAQSFKVKFDAEDGWRGSHTVSMIALCRECPLMKTSIQGGLDLGRCTRQLLNRIATKGMRLDFAELEVRCLKDRGSDILGIFSIADQRLFVTTQVAEDENVAPRDGGSVHEEPGEVFEPDVIVEDDDEDYDLKRIMTAKEVKASGVQGKMCTARDMSLRNRRPSSIYLSNSHIW